MVVDGIDNELIRLLQEDAGQSSYELAKHLMISPGAIRRRKRRLIRKGIIRERISLDYVKLGRPLAAHIAINTNQAQLDAVYEALMKLDEVTRISIVVGRYDIEAFVQLPSTDELLGFIQDKVLTIEGITHCENFICLRMGKE